MKNILAILLTAFTTMQLLAQKTYLHCGKLVDAENGKILNEQTVVIEGNKISDIYSGYATSAAAATYVDLKQYTVMPGLIDMHVHIESETKKGGVIDRFTLNPPDIAFNSIAFAQTTLMAGFTSVRDLGGTGVNIALRNAINRKAVVGPRVFTAGKIIATTGGHGDPTNGMRKDLMNYPGPEDGVINGPDDAFAAVRQRYKDGSDLIKITATGGVLSQAKDGGNPQFTIEEVKAIVSAAKDYGYQVAAHAHGAEGIKRAIIGGVNSIEHGTFMDEEGMRLAKENGTYLVPTITAGKSVADSAKIPGYYTEIVVPKALATGPQIQSTFAKAYKAGVKIAFGTDAGVFKHGKNWMEFVYMNEAGMPMMECIQAATKHAAQLLGQWSELGSISTGKFADIIAIAGNPLNNAADMEKVVFVMKDGYVFRKP